jgi:hypothetical protein
MKEIKSVSDMSMIPMCRPGLFGAGMLAGDRKELGSRETTLTGLGSVVSRRQMRESGGY